MRPSLLFLWVWVVLSSVLKPGGDGLPEAIEIKPSYSEPYFNKSALAANALMVPLTLVPEARTSGAVCLDGSLPGYHLDLGEGSGADSWLVHLEGGGWCDSVSSCVYRKKTRRGSSKYMEKNVAFAGILSNKIEENPDFFNWNRVKIRYCDGASFSGDSEDVERKLQFRGERIWSIMMKTLMLKGMKNAEKALLSGCSAGGLASILHCDGFSGLFEKKTTVKCLSDAGLFLDAVDVSGGHTLKNLYDGVVSLQGVQQILPEDCIKNLGRALCFFPQNIIGDVKTPLFLLNAAYDSWQIQSSLAPPSADPKGCWTHCRKNYTCCSNSQMQFLQGFRRQMLDAVNTLADNEKDGWFINSCFAHCQTEKQDMWFAVGSPAIGQKKIATAVGDWYFNRLEVRETDCAYPCHNTTCHNLIF